MSIVFVPTWLDLNKKYVFPVELGQGITPKASAGDREILEVSGKDLVLAAVFSGRPGRFLGITSNSNNADYAQLRVSASLSMLESKGSNLRRVGEFHNEIDPSEKSYLNYMLGGTLTLAFLTDRAAIPWMAHYSLAQKLGYKITNHQALGKVEPDYFGVNNAGDYFVAEAKGRIEVTPRLKKNLNRKNISNSLTKVKLRRIKQLYKSVFSTNMPGYAQVGSVTSINGQTPVNRFSVAIEAGRGNVNIYATDPPEKMEVPTPREWISSYYEYVQTTCNVDEMPSPGIVPEDWKPISLKLPSHVARWARLLYLNKDSSEPFATSWQAIQEMSRREYSLESLGSNLVVVQDISDSVGNDF